VLILVYAVPLLCLTCAPALADFSGPIVSVLDGETIEVLPNNRAESIRLSDIDCQEKSQAYGSNDKHAASDLPFGKEITIRTYGPDKYKFTIGNVILPEGKNLN